jgi:hypothetical protein
MTSTVVLPCGLPQVGPNWTDTDIIKWLNKRCKVFAPTLAIVQRTDFQVCLVLLLGVFVTREHVRHNKSGIAHRGRTGINH